LSAGFKIEGDGFALFYLLVEHFINQCTFARLLVTHKHKNFLHLASLKLQISRLFFFFVLFGSDTPQIVGVELIIKNGLSIGLAGHSFLHHTVMTLSLYSILNILLVLHLLKIW
jgi:hypothetical protein